MIFNEKLLFIHNGKTGGSSCADFLLGKLAGRVHNCEAEAAPSNDPNLIVDKTINRHCTLRAARAHVERLTSKGIDQFEKITVCIRHPYTLEFSFYKHLQNPQVRARRAAKAPELVALADGPFDEFVRHAGFHRPGLPQEAYFVVDDVIPSNVQLIRFENLAEEFIGAVKPYLRKDADLTFPHVNKSREGDLAAILTPKIKRLIEEKHEYMFTSGLYQPY